MSQGRSPMRGSPSSLQSTTFQSFTNTSSTSSTFGLRQGSSGDIFMGSQALIHGMETELGEERDTGSYASTATYRDRYQPHTYYNPQQVVASRPHDDLKPISEYLRFHVDRQPLQNAQSSQELGSLYSAPSQNTSTNHGAMTEPSFFPQLTHVWESSASVDNSFSSADFDDHFDYGTVSATLSEYFQGPADAAIDPALVTLDTRDFRAIQGATESPASVDSPTRTTSSISGSRQQFPAGSNIVPTPDSTVPDVPSIATPHIDTGSPEANDEDGHTRMSVAKRRKAATSKSKKSETRRWPRKISSKYAIIGALVPKLQKAADDLNQREETLPPRSAFPRNDNGLFFSSAAAAKVANNNIITFWGPPSSDSSIPSSQKAIEKVVQDLVSMIRNNQNCLVLRPEERTAFLIRWGEGATFYEEWQFEALAWAILDLMLQIHGVGWSAPVDEPKIREDTCLSMYFTFAERMDVVKEILKVSKSTCEALLKGNRLQELVGCPHTVYERIYGNRDSNNRKADELKRGTAKRKREQLKAGNAEEDQSPPASAASQAAPSHLSKKRKIVGSLKKPGNVDSAGGVTLDRGLDLDAPHEVEDTDEPASVTSKQSPRAEPPIADSTKALQAAAATGPAKSEISSAFPPTEPRSTHGKRSISEINEPDVPIAAPKKSKPTRRAKAAVKSKRKAKDVSASASADEFKAPSRPKDKAAAKASSSTFSTRSTRTTARSKTPAITVAQSGSVSDSGVGSAPIG